MTTERVQVMFLQIVAFALIVVVIVVAAVLASNGYALPSALIASIVSALVGKFFGEPLWSVTLHQIDQLPPPLAATVAKRAIGSLPPTTRAQLERANLILEGLTDPPPPFGVTKQ